MPLAIGAVFLDGVQFSTDPLPYEPANWAKRHSVHMAIGGKVTIQDFGMFMKDNTIRLGSGSERFLTEPVMLQLHDKYRTRGVMYGFSDWLGNLYQVFIKDFVVVPWMQGLDSDGVTVVSLFTYTMELHVLNIIDFFDVTYGGT